MDGDKDVPEQSGVSGEGVLAGREKYHLDSFGENVWFFSPEDDPEAVQQELMKLWGVQETNQFGDSRYAVYFLPGEYDEVIRPKVGFYMQVAGLGTMPDDVSLYTVGLGISSLAIVVEGDIPNWWCYLGRLSRPCWKK